MKHLNKPELLVPAGSLEVLKTAVLYGADAVYIGGEEFSLRAKAKNFSKEDMAEGIKYAHAHGVKVYVTANIYAHNKDIDDAKKYFEELDHIGSGTVFDLEGSMSEDTGAYKHTGKQHELPCF